MASLLWIPLVSLCCSSLLLECSRLGFRHSTLCLVGCENENEHEALLTQHPTPPLKPVTPIGVSPCTAGLPVLPRRSLGAQGLLKDSPEELHSEG